MSQILDTVINLSTVTLLRKQQNKSSRHQRVQLDGTSCQISSLMIERNHRQVKWRKDMMKRKINIFSAYKKWCLLTVSRYIHHCICNAHVTLKHTHTNLCVCHTVTCLVNINAHVDWLDLFIISHFCFNWS